MWTQISQRYKDQPGEVLFEILNEPNSKLTPELWNVYLREALAIIRRTNPVRTVVIGPGQWNQVSQLDKLELPEGDRNIIVTIHSYSPMEFTHQGARGRARETRSASRGMAHPGRRRPSRPCSTRRRRGRRSTTGRFTWASSASMTKPRCPHASATLTS